MLSIEINDARAHERFDCGHQEERGRPIPQGGDFSCLRGFRGHIPFGARNRVICEQTTEQIYGNKGDWPLFLIFVKTTVI